MQRGELGVADQRRDPPRPPGIANTSGRRDPWGEDRRRAVTAHHVQAVARLARPKVRLNRTDA
jgi:hypothetical protein